MGGARSKLGGEKRCLQCFGGKTGVKETTWKPTCIWEENNKIDLQEVGWLT